MAEEESIEEDVDHLDLLPKPVKTTKKRGKEVIAMSDRRRSCATEKTICFIDARLERIFLEQRRYTGPGNIS
jgi:hypothetical protein